MSCWSILLSFQLPANHGTIYKIVIPAMESQFSLFDSIFNPWKCQEVCQRHIYGLLYIQNFVTMGASTYFMSLYRSKVPTLKQRREWERRDFTCSQKQHWSVIDLPTITFKVCSLADIPIFIQLPMKSLQEKHECTKVSMLKYSLYDICQLPKHLQIRKNSCWELWSSNPKQKLCSPLQHKWQLTLCKFKKIVCTSAMVRIVPNSYVLFRWRHFQHSQPAPMFCKESDTVQKYLEAKTWNEAFISCPHSED